MKKKKKIKEKLNGNRDVSSENQLQSAKTCTKIHNPNVRATNTIISEQLAHNNRRHSFFLFLCFLPPYQWRENIFVSSSFFFFIFFFLPSVECEAVCLLRLQVNFIWWILRLRPIASFVENEKKKKKRRIRIRFIRDQLLNERIL